MRKLSGGVAVVTGAGSGIGRAVARALAARSCDLALCDIDEAGLADTRAALAGVRVTTQRVDVSKLDEMTRFRDAVERDFGRVSLLVNNAGVSLYGGIDHVSIADLEWIMGINFWGAVYGSKLFLPMLRREPRANIVTLSSVFGIVGVPFQAGYCASKFAIRGFSETLRTELAPTKVRLTVVHPGGIRTNISARARRGEFADVEAHARDTKAFEKHLKLSPDTAAEKIVRAVLADKPRLLIGGDAFVLDAVQRFFPARYAAVLAPLVNPTRRLRRRSLSPIGDSR
jgi:NAD(P)-dependent dehydrogenase (short-subunit alcohol dehydrogenase family)